MNFTVYDLGIAAVILLFIVLGYRRGFVMTLSSFLALFVAAIGAIVLSNLLAEPFMNLLAPLVEQHLTAFLAGHIPPDASLPQLELPEILTVLTQSPLYRGVAEAVRELLGSQAAAATTVVVTTVARQLALQIARIVLFVISFVVVLIVWNLISRALDLAFRLPVLNGLNRWAGAAVGLLKACLLLFLAAWLLADSFLPPEVIASSPLVHFFCTANPMLR